MSGAAQDPNDDQDPNYGQDPGPVTRAPLAELSPVASVGLYGGLLLSWIFVLMFGTALVLGVVAGVSGQSSSDDIVALSRTPLVLGLATVVQLGGMLMITIWFARLLGRPASETLAHRRPALVGLMGALAIGLGAGPFAGWIAQLLSVDLGLLDASALEFIGQSIVDSEGLGRAALLFAVVVGAPLVEELVFRGLLWDLLGRRHGQTAVWLITSVLFAAYHMVPIHVISVFSTGLLLGWLRRWTGSVWPGVVAHFVNNLLGVILIFAVGDDDGYRTTMLIAVVSLSLALAGAALVARWRPPAL